MKDARFCSLLKKYMKIVQAFLLLAAGCFLFNWAQYEQTVQPTAEYS
jgi:hypothetical protein